MIKKIYRKIKPILPLELKIIISKTKKDIFLIYHQFRCAINKALLFQKFIGDFDKIAAERGLRNAAEKVVQTYYLCLVAF